MNGSIYVISTYYHAFISCVKQLVNKENADILVTGYIPESDILAERLKQSGLFHGVYLAGDPTEYIPRNKIDLLINLHRKNAEMIEPAIPVDLRSYQTVNIFHDDTWVAHYLKDCRIRYRLIEDGLDSFKTIKDTPFSYMVTKRSLVSVVKRTLRIGYVFSGYDPLTTEIEVNDKNGVVIDRSVKHKLVEVPRAPLLRMLTDKDIEVLKSIFARDIPEIDPLKSVLLLTQPIYADGNTVSKSEQAELYRMLVSDHINADETLVIKPHPRDETDYSAVFPDAVIINKNLPAEMLTYFNINTKKLIGFNSTAMKTVNADQRFYAELNKYLQKIRRTNND